MQDSHSSCGNGVAWSLELRGVQRRTLRSGIVESGGKATVDPLDQFPVRQGDLISLIIDARDRDHVCDLTEIDLTITQMDGESRVWSLSEDCADTIDAANPHADRFGHESIWHFFAGPVGANETRQVIPPESLLAQWLDTSDREEAAQLAVQIQELVTRPEAPDSPARCRTSTSIDFPRRPYLLSLGFCDPGHACQRARVGRRHLWPRSTTIRFPLRKRGYRPAAFGGECPVGSGD